jgi:hypothetical protein
MIHEMDGTELEDCTGGNPALITIMTGVAVGVTLAVTNSILNNWDNFKAGLAGEVNPALSKTNK